MNAEIDIRMKRYEHAVEINFPPRIPVIIRIDGRAFHTFTRKRYGKKYNEEFNLTMQKIAVLVSRGIQGCNFAYGQSDEISFLLTDYQTIKTDSWFGYDLQKMVSIAASKASGIGSILFNELVEFDARAFSMPQDEVCNYFIWRQQDATRNAIQMLGTEHFTQKELHKKNTKQIQEMVFAKTGINFDKLPIARKRGYSVVKNELDLHIPIFSKARSFVEDFVYVRED